MLYLKSSIRHALYQKWFRKITVCDEKISNKGCFWMINRENNPREWCLPSTTSTAYGGEIVTNMLNTFICTKLDWSCRCF